MKFQAAIFQTAILIELRKQDKIVQRIDVYFNRFNITDSALLTIQARKWLISGRVQGVGFRPFIYRLAAKYALSGWVKNQSGQVEIFAQGEANALQAFEQQLISAAPPLAQPVIQTCVPQALINSAEFQIIASSAENPPRIHVPPDYFTCADCLRELHDPQDRRYQYPFTNCTQCGPRYTVIVGLPYDRQRTTLADFPLCPDCQRESRNPLDRRFHAEPIACPQCGPQLTFKKNGEETEIYAKDALAASVAALQAGLIIAVKGVGGYHLLCDAGQDRTINRLRARKPRPSKPLAVMFPVGKNDELAYIHAAVDLTSLESAALISPTRPIVLAQKRLSSPLSEHIAPQLREIGVMLPYSPLHHLLLEHYGKPLIATSANLRGEPVLTENYEVEQRLSHIAEAFLHHNRPIARPADDPVFRQIAGQLRPLRLGRGVAPLELELPFTLSTPTLAVGGQTKNTIALAWENRLVISPHIGDLESPWSLAVFKQVVFNLQNLYQTHAEKIICDAHPGYTSSRWAKQTGLPLQKVWHHHAHAAAVAGEFPEVKNWLIFTWDGVGYGENGALWGGEAFLGKPKQWRRAACFRPFALPGGEKAAHEPWRSAASLCWENGINWQKLADKPQLDLLYQAWQRRLNCPLTSAVGRLFDAAAALLGLTYTASFEGEGPMKLEAQAQDSYGETINLPLRKNAQGLWQTDWSPLLPYLLDETLALAERAAGFHYSLAQALVEQALAVKTEQDFQAIGLSGGVFQNRFLTECAFNLLQNHGFTVHLPKQIPVNDAGLSFGQVVEGAMRYE